MKLKYNNRANKLKKMEGKRMELLTQVMYLGIAVGILSLLAAFYYAKKVEHYQINIP